MKLDRRAFLGAGLAASASLLVDGFARRARAQALPAVADRLLFVVAAAGGGSIVDSFLPVADTEVGDPALAARLAVQPSSLVHQDGATGLRCVLPRGGSVAGLPAATGYSQATFLQKHGQDVAVMCVEGTSVNHLVAQKRALTGAGVDGGRTLMEAMAERHGAGLILPNCNMAQGGYLEGGDDPRLDERFRPEALADARVFPLATDGVRGVTGAPERALVERARRVREDLDDLSPFGRTFAGSSLRRRFLQRRRELLPQMEQLDLITRLMLVEDAPEFPLTDHDLQPSPDAARLRQRFPDLLSDPLQAQAALAFLLAKTGVATAVTISPSFAPLLRGLSITNTPLAFDFSHGDHPATQNLMWNRVLSVVDALIDLLKEEGLWDRSLVYFATDFGRDKTRPEGAETFGTGHHLNNGVVLVSPLLRGGRVYGGVDPTTLLTYGFDRQTGAPAPGTVMREGDVYAAICQAMDVDYDGRVDVPCMIRGA